ncbi:hypothetical protein LUZ60_016218 [Juncus effusus]|nr:hypothetical protein LUZ60_016218 [Juncus effusus]
MRIRRTVKKLLGSAVVYPTLTDNWAQHQSSVFDEGCVDSGLGEVCQLNQSPWDASPNLDLFSTACQGLESTTNSKEEAQPAEKKEEETAKAITEKNEGILVNSTLKDENKTEPIRLCKRAKKSTKKTDHTEMKEKISEEDILCKKHDGRKWFCKRPAQLPHKFCEYHVVQSRSYYNGLPPKPKPKPKKQKKDGKNKETTSSSSFFYYYEGFGPWRGKRRGERNTEPAPPQNEEEEKEDSNKKDQERRGERQTEAAHYTNKEEESDKKDDVIMDGCDLLVAGLVEDDNDDYEEIVASSSKRTGEKKVGKKRGRKPLKCRSLKSLM